MAPFDFYTVPRIVFGPGKIAQLGEMASAMASRALVIHNGGDIGRGGPVDRAAAILQGANVHTLFHRQRGEPTLTDVDAALAMARTNQCPLIIGLGGGSAIDAAKAVAGLLTNGGDTIDYMEIIGNGRKITRPAAPWIAVPTTAGTGAEVTRNAVIGAPEKKFKASIRSEMLLARVALVDPELGINLPPEVTAASGMDALCQLVESYTSSGAQPMTDALALRGFELASRALPRAYRSGGDLEARSEMALAALLGGITLTNAGLGAVHGFAAPLGANFDVPHGVVCAALLPHVVAANIKALGDDSPVIDRYITLGKLVVADARASRHEALAMLAQFLVALGRDLQIPALGRFGIDESCIPEMVALSKKTSSMRFNPVVLSDETLGNVLRAAM